MVEVQVGKDDAVDVGVGKTRPLKAVEKDVALFLDAEPVPELRREKRADAGLEQDASVLILDQ